MRDTSINHLYSEQIKQTFERLERRDFFDSKIVFEVYYYVFTLAHLLLQNINIYKTVLPPTQQIALGISRTQLRAALFLRHLPLQAALLHCLDHPADSPSRWSEPETNAHAYGLHHAVLGLRVLRNQALLPLLRRLHLLSVLSVQIDPEFGRAILHFCVFGWFSAHRYSSPINELVHLIKSKRDFQAKTVGVVFHSFEVAYFVGFLPVKFIVQEEIQFDPYCTLSLTLFFWVNSSIFLISHFMFFKSGELHHQALQYGSWKKLTLADLEKQYGPHPGMQKSFVPTQFQQGTKYKKRSVVEYAGIYYESLESNNICKPGELLPTLLYVMFHPSTRGIGIFQVAAQDDGLAAADPLLLGPH